MKNDIFLVKECVPDEENILKAFQKDTVDRVDSVISMYEMINRPAFDISSISIDGQWGSGKTFFVKMLLELFRIKNTSSELSECQETISELSYIDQLEESKVYPLYYDAWENDSMSEPILSLLYSICKQTKIDAKFDADMVEVTKTLSRHLYHFLFTGLSTFTSIPNLSNIADSLCKFFSSNEPFSPVIDTLELKEKISDLLIKILSEIGKPIVIFVDELDRCKPTFAIELLESIKHYFFNEKILFVFSVNIEELQHSIRSVYGQGFNATKYLDRFFNIRFNLPQVVVKDFLKKELKLDSQSNILILMIQSLSEIYHLELREIIKYESQVRFVSHCPHNDFENIETNNGYTFICGFFIPLALCLKFYNQNKFVDFITGNGSEILTDLFEYDVIRDICSRFLKYNEESISIDRLRSRLIHSYKFILSKTQVDRKFGNIILNEKSYKLFNNKVCLIE